MLITKKSLLAAIAKNNGNLTEDYMCSSAFVPYWKHTHISRVRNTIRAILRKGWIWVAEDGKLAITDHGKAVLEQNTAVSIP